MKFRNQYIPILCLVSLLVTACASGSSIVTGTTRSPTEASEVKLYLEPPKEYEVIGIVKASSGAGWTEQGDMDYAVAELKNQAAKLGANGVILISTGESTSTTVGTYGSGVTVASSSSEQTLTGKAIYVSK